MAAGQLDIGFPGQGAIPAQAFRQAAFQQLRMAQGTNPVGQHPGKRQVRLVARQAQSQGAEGLGHGGAIDHPQHRHAEMPRQIGAGRGAIEQAHDPLDQNQVGLSRRLPEQTAAFLLAHHPHVQLVHRGTTGALKNHRVEEIRAALEDPDLAPPVAVQAGKGRGHRGLALAGSRCGDQHCRAMTNISHEFTLTARHLSAP